MASIRIRIKAMLTARSKMSKAVHDQIIDETYEGLTIPQMLPAGSARN
jgi:hypothetical protein